MMNIFKIILKLIWLSFWFFVLILLIRTEFISRHYFLLNNDDTYAKKSYRLNKNYRKRKDLVLITNNIKLIIRSNNISAIKNLGITSMNNFIIKPLPTNNKHIKDKLNKLIISPKNGKKLNTQISASLEKKQNSKVILGNLHGMADKKYLSKSKDHPIGPHFKSPHAYTEYYLNNKLSSIIKKIIKQYPIIKRTYIYKTWKGKGYLYMEIRKIIARVIDGKMDYYIDEFGYKVPMSMTYTFNVILIKYSPIPLKDSVSLSLGTTKKQNSKYKLTWNRCDNISLFKKYPKFSKYDSKLLDFIKHINNNKFFKSQIACLFIDNFGYIKLYTRIGKQVIEFGQPENIKLKLKKFKTIYTKLLPKIGWNKYNRINIEFENQIVCQ